MTTTDTPHEEQSATVENLTDLTSRVKALRDQLLVDLVERDVAVRLALLAALAGEHLLLIGPPGTAKSLVARRLHLAFLDTPYFERLLTRFTVPEELFGPLSIKGLEEDRYERITERYLPKAGIAFLDEIFKANSAVLNALLTLLNEREFDNGTHREKTPLVVAIGASNELPEGEELDALFDRFLLRLHVDPVSKDGFRSLLKLRGEAAATVSAELRLSEIDTKAIREAAPTVGVPDDVIALLSSLREWCMAEGIRVSDRRWRKVVRLLQTAAHTNGRTMVSIWDCWLLQHCIWNRPEERAKVYKWYAERAGASAAMNPAKLTRIVALWEGKLKTDQEARSQAHDESGQLLYVGANGEPTTNKSGPVRATRDKELLFLAPPNLQDDYGRQRQLERTVGGSGYTRKELDGLRYMTDQYDNQCQFVHWPGRDAYLANEANWLMKDVALAPLMEPTRQKGAYLDWCLQEISKLRQDVEAYQRKLETHIATLHADIRANLWVTSDFIEPAALSLDGTRNEVVTLLSRINALREGFEMLPREQIPGPNSPDAE